ncbi:MAG: VOC family protein [Prochlorothrix sp.]|nr:VOC family protein [Prochlorothrix sp.]
MSPESAGDDWIRSGFIAIGTSDLDALVTFYRDLLDQDPQVYQADRYGEFRIPGLRLALFQPQADQADQFRSTIGGSLSVCITVSDLDRAIDRCCDLHLSPSAMQMASHGREFFVQDPLGNRILFYEPHRS